MSQGHLAIQQRRSLPKLSSRIVRGVSEHLIRISRLTLVGDCNFLANAVQWLLLFIDTIVS